MRKYAAFTLLILGMLAFSIGSPMTANAQTDPPETGPWIIEDDTIIEDQDLLVNYNIIIRDGGSLTLNNCNLTFACMFEGQYGIELEAGGQMLVHNTSFTNQIPRMYFRFSVAGYLYMEHGNVSGSGALLLAGGLDVVEGTAILRNTTVLDCKNYGIEFGVGARGDIQDCRICNNGYSGMYVGSGSIVNVTSSTIQGNSGNGISYYTDCSGYVKNSIIRGNLNHGFEVDENTSTILENCILYNNGWSGVGIENPASTTLINCNSSRNGDHGFSLRGRNIVISDCQADDNEDCGMILFDHHGIIENVSMDNNAEFGIQCSEGSTSIIRDCTITRTHQTGITIGDIGTSCNITNCFLNRNQEGIQISKGSNPVVQGNTITNTVEEGIIVFNSGTSPIIKHNLIQGQDVGLKFIRNSDPLVIGNQVLESDSYGLISRDASTPRIYNSTIEGTLLMGNLSIATFINSSLSEDAFFFNDSDSRADLGWWVSAFVQDEAGTPVPQAAVNAVGNNGDITFSIMTGANGHTKEVPMITSKLTLGQKVELNPFNFSARKGNLTGYRYVNITKNMFVKLTLGTHIGPLIPGELFMSFMEPKNGTWLSGEVTIKVRAGPWADKLIFILIDGDDEIRLGCCGAQSMSQDGLYLTFRFQWDSTNQSNGEYELVARAVNQTFSLASQRKVVVFINNPEGGATSAIMAVGLAAFISLGAAVALGTGSAAAGTLGGGMEDAAGEYAEERLAARSLVQASHPAMQGLYVIITAVILAGSLAYASSTDVKDILELFVYMLVGTSLVVIAMEGMEAVMAWRHSLRGGFKIWPAGLLTLILSTLLLKLPFGSPGKTIVRGGPMKGSGLSAASKLLAAPALFPVFIFFAENGYHSMGLVGGYTIVMLFMIDSLPIHPLEGRRVFGWSKLVWLLLFGFALYLLLAWQEGWLEPVTYNYIGFGAIAALVLTIIQSGGD